MMRRALIAAVALSWMNRAELVTKTRSYFAQSVGREVEVAAWSGREDAATAGKSLALLDRV